MNVYAALLRGINVGGNNVIKMAELKAAFEGMGFESMRTFQSGNVVFGSPQADIVKLAAQIERALSRQFGDTAMLACRCTKA